MIGLVTYRHGLLVSEACDLRWDDIDLPKRTIIVRQPLGRPPAPPCRALELATHSARRYGAYAEAVYRARVFTPATCGGLASAVGFGRSIRYHA